MELKTHHLSKFYTKEKAAVADVNLVLQEGIHALLGANGSGKTTLMRMLCGILKPSEGIVTFNAKNIMENYEEYILHLGYLPQNAGFYMNFTVIEFLQYIAVLKCLEADYAKRKIDELLELLQLKEQSKKKLRQLSGGMLQRVGIAQSLLNHPKLLILDEPSSGLDPKERIALRQLLSRLAKDTIVILSTHIVSDIENIADDILLMKEGHILFQKTVTDTLQELKGHVYELLTAENEREIIEKNYTVVNCKRVSEGILFRLLSDDMKDKRSIVVEPTLDDVYLSYFHEEAEYVETNLL